MRLARGAASAVAGLLLVLPSATAGSHWVRMRTPHFDVLSDAPADQAFRTALRLEAFRDVIHSAFASRSGADAPRRMVLAFGSRSGLEPFLPVRKGRTVDLDGFFQSGPDGGTIVMNLGRARAEQSAIAAHEYAHAFLADVLPAQPAWVAEGLAELYGNWDGDDGRVHLGSAIPDHLRTLRTEGLLPLRALLAADYASDHYNEEDKQGRFYASAWALVHFLTVRTGPAQLQAFLAALANGDEAEAAFARTWGDMETVQAALVAYVAEPLPEIELPRSPSSSDPEAAISVPPAALVDTVEGLLLLDTQRLKAAESHLVRALEADATFAPAREAMTRLYLETGRWKEARALVRSLLEAEPDRPRALFQEAQALVREAAVRGTALSDEETARATRILERALDAAPGLAEACALLVHLRPQPIGDSLARIQRARAAGPGHVELGLAEADLHLLTGDFPRAEAALRRARSETRDDVTRFISGHMLKRIAAAAAGTAEIAGTLVALECTREGALVFVVAAAGTRVRLLAPSPTAFFLYDLRGEPVEHTLQCGAQRSPVRARYRRLEGEPRADGILLSATLG